MKKLLNVILNLFVKPKLDERKQALRKKLEKEISETDSEWVKIRNQVYLELLDSADGKLMDLLEKKINNIWYVKRAVLVNEYGFILLGAMGAVSGAQIKFMYVI